MANRQKDSNEEGSVPRDASLSHMPLLLAQHGFIADSIVDGPGLRCTVFVQGCPHACPGCHNPATHPFEGGVPTTAGALFERIRQSPLCRAVTLSGGEPFCQAEGLLVLASLLKAEGYELAAYTGYSFEALLAGTDAQRALLKQLDTLVDGQFVLEKRD